MLYFSNILEVFTVTLPGICTMREVLVLLTSFMTPILTQYLPGSLKLWLTIKLQELLSSTVRLRISPGGRLHCLEMYKWKDTGRLVKKNEIDKEIFIVKVNMLKQKFHF